MIRRLYTIASALSLLVSIAAVGLWIRSFRVADSSGRWKEDERARVDIILSNGRAMWSEARLDVPISNIDHQWRHWTGDSIDLSIGRWNGTRTHFRAFGIVFDSGRRSLFDDGGADASDCTLVLPFWLALPFTLPVAAIWRIAIARSRGRRFGHCSACGYDLRASRGRCPECGMPIMSNTRGRT